MADIMKRITMPIGHRLMNYSGGCANIHGHNIAVELIFNDDIIGRDSTGFVIDFGYIKQQVGNLIKEYFDHVFLVNPFDTEVINFLEKEDMDYYVMPMVMYCGNFHDYVGLCNPTAENTANLIFLWVYDFAQKHDIGVTEVRVWESETAYASVTCLEYEYTDKLDEIEIEDGHKDEIKQALKTADALHKKE